MSFLDGILNQFGGHTLESLSDHVGLTPDQVQEALGTLHQTAQWPGDTAQMAADKTGIPVDIMQTLLQHVGGEAGVAQIMGALGGAHAGDSGIGALIGNFFNRNGNS